MSEGAKLLTAIAENGSSTTLRLLDDSYFVDDQELELFRFMINHTRRYGSVPEIETIEDQFSERLPDTPESVDFYLDRVHDRYVYNGVRERFGSLREALQSVDIPLFTERLNGIKEICRPFRGQQQELVTLHDLRDNVEQDYEQRHLSPGLVGIPVGWEYMDEELGGYINGDVNMWVARPGVGKSWLLIHQVLAAHYAGKSVLLVSMEMPLEQFGARIASYVAGVNPTHVRHGKLSWRAREMFGDALSTFTNSHSFHLYAGNFSKTTNDLEAVIDQTAPDVIYVDGVYLMRPSVSRHNMGRFEAAAYLMDEVKRIALQYDRPFIGTTQFGRGAGNKGEKGGLDTIGYTDTIGTHSSVIVGIKPGKEEDVHERARYPIDDVGEAEPDEFEVNDSIVQCPIVRTKKMSFSRLVEIMKGREGESGAFGINYRFTPTDFNEIPVSKVLGEPEQVEAPNLDYMEGQENVRR